jgi:hypothetical protein
MSFELKYLIGGMALMDSCCNESRTDLLNVLLTYPHEGGARVEVVLPARET